MPTIRIDVELPQQRLNYGQLRVFNDAGSLLAGPFDALGRADATAAANRGNPSRDPTRSYGDTPTGRFRGFVNSIARTPINDRTYGPQSIIALDPTAGQALTAKQNGRFGLLIHGGEPNAAGRLRHTFGCVRVANASMVSILAAIPAGARIDVSVIEV